MPFDEHLFDESLYDENGDPIQPDRIYLRSAGEPCSKWVFLPSIDETALGEIQLWHSIYLSGIAGTERFGRLRLIQSIILSGIDGAEAVSDITVSPGAVTVRLPSIQEPACA